ncbi:hypothetical protein CBI38_32425 (plasmid) [Rhodococcus oxybenzonivorans]|uniref:Uncharacterized protein n=1 Tax=Rhodococcus oxybenzonivorans TaxID=1990687 RepID=A0A2S2C5R0_9NOCA|nr:hypothetical protein [Rhodococcus oxybenzonivorans]AWK76205.1 hypothetical protein CBI38_32425 [Rhodococcus oxybenzonivorans]
MLMEGVVRVDHHQFTVGTADAYTLDAVEQGTLIEVGPGFISSFTGISYGPARLSIEILDSAGPDDTRTSDWEVVEESEIVAVTDILVMEIDGTRAADFDPIAPGRYGVRAHAKGRDRNAGLEVTEPTEEYFIQLWLMEPSDAGAPGIRRLHKTDAAWSADETVEHPTPNQDYVYVFDQEGQIQRVAPNSAEAEATRAQLQEFGGRPLTPALEAVYASQYVAGLDRDLIDRIEAAPPERQRAFARWCVHRAFERAGIADIDWIRDALNSMDAGDIPPREFTDYWPARARLDKDPRISRTIVSGLPGTTEQVQQYEALTTYARATYDDDRPLALAIETFRFAATVYGMDYRDLCDAARSDFFQSS